MTKPAQSTLLALIEAGQHAHRAVLRPLAERGLVAGDDALILLLGEGTASEADIEASTGTDIEQLRPRLDRLVMREMIVRTAAGFALTDRGARLRERLLDVWADTELSLTGALKKKQRKRLARLLLEFAEHLAARADP